MIEKAKIRYTTFTESGEVVVGRRKERVVAFELRNAGQNSTVRLSIDGAGISLAPGEEKVYALDGKVYFDEAYLLSFAPDGAGVQVNSLLLSEIYITNNKS